MLLAVAAPLLLAGCSDKAAKPAARASTTASLAGTAMPSALTQVQCHQVKGGSWTATGTVSNTERRSYSFEVAVLVSDSGAGTATVERLASVQPQSSTSFSVTGVGATGANPTCRVRVSRLD